MRRKSRHMHRESINPIKRLRIWRLAIVLVCVLALVLGGELAVHEWWLSPHSSHATVGQKHSPSPTPTDAPAQKGNATSASMDMNQLHRLQQEYAGANG